MKKDEVKAKITHLRKPQERKALASKDFKRQLYLEIMTDSRQKTIDRLRASELDAKMAGHFEPDQVIIETGPKTLEALEARAASLVSALDSSRA